jgi:hypothetical protein
MDVRYGVAMNEANENGHELFTCIPKSNHQSVLTDICFEFNVWRVPNSTLKIDAFVNARLCRPRQSTIATYFKAKLVLVCHFNCVHVNSDPEQAEGGRIQDDFTRIEGIIFQITNPNNSHSILEELIMLCSIRYIVEEAIPSFEVFKL